MAIRSKPSCPSCGAVRAENEPVCPDCGLAFQTCDVAPRPNGAATPSEAAPDVSVALATATHLHMRYRIVRAVTDAAAAGSPHVFLVQDTRCTHCPEGTVGEDGKCDQCGQGTGPEALLVCQITPQQEAVLRAVMEALADLWPDRLIRCRDVFLEQGVPFAVLADGMSQPLSWSWRHSADAYEEAVRVLHAIAIVTGRGFRFPHLEEAVGLSGEQLVLTPVVLGRAGEDARAVTGLPSAEETAVAFLRRLAVLADETEQVRVSTTIQGVIKLMQETSSDYVDTAMRGLSQAAEDARRVPCVRLISGRVSSEGVYRRGSANEDSALVLELSRVWVADPQSFGFYGVADGMGGHDAGEVASRLALETLSAWVLRQIVEPWMLNATLSSEEVGRRLLQGVEEAHRRVRDGSGEEAERDMGTTLTAAVVLDGLAYVVNVGDSRTYLFRGETRTLRQVSHDHSVVQELVDRGEIAPEDVYTDPRRNVILASLGAPSEMSGVDLFVETIGPSDKLLLCSDGLWEMIFDRDIAEVMARNNDPQSCAEELVMLACAHGGVDNVTAVVVQVQDRPSL